MAQFTYPLKAAGVLGHKSGAYPNALGLVDDFESGDIAEYKAATGQYGVDTATVHSGTYSLTVSSGGSAYKLGSTSGLPSYPAQGDSFECYTYLNSTSGPSTVLFGVGDAANPTYNAYGAAYAVHNGKLKINRWVNGSWTAIANVSLSSNVSGAWLRLKVDWATDGTITVTATDTSTGTQLAQASATDTNHTSGGIGFTMKNSNTVWWDDYEIL